MKNEDVEIIHRNRSRRRCKTSKWKNQFYAFNLSREKRRCQPKWILTVVCPHCVSRDVGLRPVSSAWSVVFVIEPVANPSAKYSSVDPPFPWISRSFLCSPNYLRVPTSHFSTNNLSSGLKTHACCLDGRKHPEYVQLRSLRLHPSRSRTRVVRQFWVSVVLE